MIFAIDSGFGVDKYAFRDLNNEINFGKVSSAIAEAPLEAEDMPFFEGRRYYLGEIALMEESSSIKNVLDYKDHETFAPLSIWHVLDENKVDPEQIEKLSVGLSLAQKDYARQFVNRISKFSVNGKKFDFKDKVVLVPQAIGAKFAIDHYYFNNEKSTYAIIDIGQLTVDTVTVVNGVVRRENAAGSAHDGIIKIIQELQEYIASNKDLNQFLSIKEVQEILKNGSYSSYGEDYDLSEIISQLKKNYTRFLMASLKDKYNNIFKKYNKIFFVGGGAYYIDLNEVTSITNIPSKAFIIPENPEYLNAIGNLIAAEAQ